MKHYNTGNKNGKYKHGKYLTPEYTAWGNMIARCTLPTHPRYEDWGGRGITVCDKWLTFIGFYADMGNRPTTRHTLERKNNNLGYCKENCRWATTQEQARNRRSNKHITYKGTTLIQNDWATKAGVSQVTFASRMSRGWAPQEAILGKREETNRHKSAVKKHLTGDHSRNCECYISRNTYKCKFTGSIYKKGVAYGRPY